MPYSTPLSANASAPMANSTGPRSEEHTSELQSQSNLVCRLLLEKKKQSALGHDIRGVPVLLLFPYVPRWTMPLPRQVHQQTRRLFGAHVCPSTIERPAYHVFSII